MSIRKIELRCSYKRWMQMIEKARQCKTDHDVLDLCHNYADTIYGYRTATNASYARESLDKLKENIIPTPIK